MQNDIIKDENYCFTVVDSKGVTHSIMGDNYVLVVPDYEGPNCREVVEFYSEGLVIGRFVNPSCYTVCQCQYSSKDKGLNPYNIENA